MTGSMILAEQLLIKVAGSQVPCLPSRQALPGRVEKQGRIWLALEPGLRSKRNLVWQKRLERGENDPVGSLMTSLNTLMPPAGA